MSFKLFRSKIPQNLNTTIKEKKKSRPISDVEWFVLWLVSSFIIIKCLMIYQGDGSSVVHYPDSKYLYIAVAAILVWLISAAKLPFGFNIFRAIRNFPKLLINGYKQQREDLENWINDRDLEEH